MIKKWLVYLQSTHSQTVRCVNAENDLKSLVLPSIMQVECGTCWDPVHIPSLQLSLSQFMMVYQSQVSLPCKNI